MVNLPAGQVTRTAKRKSQGNEAESKSDEERGNDSGKGN